MEIHNINDLNKRGVLEHHDTVHIAGLKYRVTANHLVGITIENRAIFKKLKIHDPAKFCSKYYGYSDTTHEYQGWPESKYRDYSALTRLVEKLYQLTNQIRIY